MLPKASALVLKRIAFTRDTMFKQHPSSMMPLSKPGIVSSSGTIGTVFVHILFADKDAELSVLVNRRKKELVDGGLLAVPEASIPLSWCYDPSMNYDPLLGACRSAHDLMAREHFFKMQDVDLNQFIPVMLDS